jgi:single-strand DNA-binding protein
MSSVNKVILIGNFGQDPEARQTNGGQDVANFTLATNRKFKKKDGEQVDETEWHRLVAWGKQAEIICKYCTKGSKIYVEGRLQTRSYDDKDGVKKYTTEIVVENFTFLGDKGGQANGGSGGGGGHTPPPAAAPDADLPF